MNSLPPAFTSASFNSNAFSSSKYVTRADADRLYLPMSAGTVLSYLTGITPGTAAASRALVLNSSSNINGINVLGATTLTLSNTTNASSVTNGGTFTTAGGAAIAKTLYVGSGVNLDTAAGGDMLSINVSSASGRGTIKWTMDTGGWEFGCRGSAAANPNTMYWYNGSYKMLLNTSGDLSILSATSSSSSSSGALTVAGGVGAAGVINAGSNMVAGAGLHSYGISSTNLSAFGAGAHIHYAAGRAAYFGYNYTTSLYTNMTMGNDAIFIDGTTSLVGIGTTTPTTAGLVVNSFASSSIAGTYGYLNGQGAGSGSGTGSVNVSIRCGDRLMAVEVDCSSDRRLKDEIRDVSEAEALALLSVTPVHFKWRRTGEQSFGYIAQDVLKAGSVAGEMHLLDDLTSLVDNDEMEEVIDEDGFVSPGSRNFLISYQKCVPLLHKVIQMHQTQIDEMRAELISLREELSAATGATTPPKKPKKAKSVL